VTMLVPGPTDADDGESAMLHLTGAGPTLVAVDVEHAATASAEQSRPIKHAIRTAARHGRADDKDENESIDDWNETAGVPQSYVALPYRTRAIDSGFPNSCARHGSDHHANSIRHGRSTCARVRCG